MSEEQSVFKAVLSGERKAQLAISQPGHYALRSVLAGLYLSLIVMVYWALSDGLKSSPFGKVVASGFFGVGLCVIVFTEAELFTSNCFYLTISTLKKRTTWGQALRVWVMSWLGNFCGALLLTVFLYQAQVLTTLNSGNILFSGALHKAHQSLTVLLWKGVLANWVVCLAVWMALRLKEEVAKMSAIILVVFTFLYLGFEHSIANMGTFCFAIAGGGQLTVGAALRNLAVSTIGNLIGGGVLVGAAYAALTAPCTEDSKAKAEPRHSEGHAELA
jgi:nitrite transporter NirC